MTFYKELKRAMLGFITKNTGAVDSDMILNTIEKTLVGHFITDINEDVRSKKRGIRYNRGYRQAMSDVEAYYKENYVERRHSSLDH